MAQTAKLSAETVAPSEKPPRGPAGCWGQGGGEEDRRKASPGSGKGDKAQDKGCWGNLTKVGLPGRGAVMVGMLLTVHTMPLLHQQLALPSHGAFLVLGELGFSQRLIQR